MHEPRAWSWTEFICGWINKRFVAFIVITLIIRDTFSGQADNIKTTMLIIWTVVTVIWMLSGALEKMIENAKMNVEAKLGASVGK